MCRLHFVVMLIVSCIVGYSTCVAEPLRLFSRASTYHRKAGYSVSASVAYYGLSFFTHRSPFFLWLIVLAWLTSCCQCCCRRGAVSAQIPQPSLHMVAAASPQFSIVDSVPTTKLANPSPLLALASGAGEDEGEFIMPATKTAATWKRR